MIRRWRLRLFQRRVVRNRALCRCLEVGLLLWVLSPRIRISRQNGTLGTFLPRTISLVDRHSGIHQGTGRCRCSHSTGAITADTVQIERSGCSGTSADSEHLYSITHSPCRSVRSSSPHARIPGISSLCWMAFSHHPAHHRECIIFHAGKKHADTPTRTRPDLDHKHHKSSYRPYLELEQINAKRH